MNLESWALLSLNSYIAVWRESLDPSPEQDTNFFILSLSSLLSILEFLHCLCGHFVYVTDGVIHNIKSATSNLTELA